MESRKLAFLPCWLAGLLTLTPLAKEALANLNQPWPGRMANALKKIITDEKA